MLTMYIIPGHPSDDNPDRAKKSLEGVAQNIMVVDRTDIGGQIQVSTPFYGFIHANELMSEGARVSLTTFLLSGTFDVLVFYKIMFDVNQYRERLFKRPRIFAKYVEVSPVNLYPISPAPVYLKFETLLDGWIYHAGWDATLSARLHEINQGFVKSDKQS